jgi:hypothetical protein
VPFDNLPSRKANRRRPTPGSADLCIKELHLTQQSPKTVVQGDQRETTNSRDYNDPQPPNDQGQGTAEPRPQKGVCRADRRTNAEFASQRTGKGNSPHFNPRNLPTVHNPNPQTPKRGQDWNCSAYQLSTNDNHARLLPPTGLHDLVIQCNGKRTAAGATRTPQYHFYLATTESTGKRSTSTREGT